MKRNKQKMEDRNRNKVIPNEDTPNLEGAMR